MDVMKNKEKALNRPERHVMVRRSSNFINYLSAQQFVGIHLLATICWPNEWWSYPLNLAFCLSLLFRPCPFGLYDHIHELIWDNNDLLDLFISDKVPYLFVLDRLGFQLLVPI